jgi:hypothetical protein
MIRAESEEISGNNVLWTGRGWRFLESFGDDSADMLFSGVQVEPQQIGDIIIQMIHVLLPANFTVEIAAL